jgi:nucleotide-binding universal stress UspA family protein
VTYEKSMNFEMRLQIEETSLIEKVLVAVDGSENSDKALDFALDLAEKYSASVLIMNVFQPPPVYGYPDVSSSYQANVSGFVKDLRKFHEGLISKAAEKATKLKPEVKITTILKEGDPSSQIVETAYQDHFDIVVLGHRGWSRIQEFFLGSTSERVAHLARCTVLIVK